VRLETDYGRDLPVVVADKSQLETAVMNLAVNARDAMPEGGKLFIETSNLFLDKEYAGAHLAVSTGPHAMLAVTDTGVGMSPEVQAHIFEPFFTTKPQGEGTGLGLATVYGIVQQMEGTIWVYSEPGKGTTFKIFFPVIQEGMRSEVELAEEALPAGGQVTILLVEDEEGVRKFVRSMLEKQGYTVLPAANTEEAMALFTEKSESIDLMLTDVIMPRMNGTELAERVRALKPDVKVLFMSGYTDRAMRLHERLASSALFIQKPFTPNSLAQKVREILGKAENQSHKHTAE
jgi:CheY-like chemotaxis protein